MNLSLPMRLFLVHLVFTVGAGAAAIRMVLGSFERYQASWERQVAAAFTAELFQPLANEVARALLLAQEADFPEVRAERVEQIGSGLRAVLREIGSIRAIVVVDPDLRIQFASDAAVADLAFKRAEDRRFLSAAEPQRRVVRAADGTAVEELAVPVYDERPAAPAAGTRRRLGSVLVRFVPDPDLAARVRGGSLPSIPTEEFALPVILFLGATVAGGLAVAALTGLPVRRLDRALAELRRRDFRGGLDAGQLGLEGRLAGAVQAINELGGRLEVLDARGRERDALLDRLSQSLEEGMVALAPDGTPEAWNAAALRLLTGDDGAGRERAEIVDRLRGAMQANPALRPTEDACSTVVAADLEIVRADDSRVPVRVTQSAFRPADGTSGTLILIRDLGTLRSIESHLADAGRFAVVAHLAAGLAHEIRNPLHSIGINATVVEQHVGSATGPPRHPAVVESLATIKEEAGRLADLLNSYLGLVRPESSVGLVDLREVCGRVKQLIAFSARRSRVEIRQAGDAEGPVVRGVGDRLQQAILNLTLNALQAMPDGGVLTLETGREPGWAHVRVSDTGPGVPAELRGRLFESTWTTKPGGRGLGLPLVRMIAEAHGGQVRYGEAGGGGAMFSLLLPLARGE